MGKKGISRRAATITFWISVVVLIISVVLLIMFDSIYQANLKKEITLAKGTLMTKIWEDIPLPIYERLYFFNITNGHDFVKNGARLNLSQVGPYTYKGRWVKQPEWHSNFTVSYREVRTWHFVPEMSEGDENDTIYTLNGPMIIAANMLKSYNLGLKMLLSFALKLENEDVIIKKTIKELSYGGYKDFIIQFAPLINPDIPYKNGRFSWLYGKNATDDGVFTVFTGADDGSKTGLINNWNGRDSLSFWNGDTCNMLNGTSIEVGPPIKGDQESYTFFQSIFCRSITYNRTGEKTHYGLKSVRFEPNYSVFANGSEDPSNYCFDLEKGLPSGVLDISPCQFGAPAFLSFPHFYMADPIYLKSISGLEPNAGDHGSYVDVETISGISIGIMVRFQINLQLSRVKGIFQLDRVPEGIFPIFWAELNLAVNEEWAHYFIGKLNNPKTIAYSVLGVLAGISALLVIVSVVILWLSKDEDDDVPLLIPEKEDHKTPSRTEKRNKDENQHNYGTCAANESGEITECTVDFQPHQQRGVTNKASDVSNDIYSGTESSELPAGKSGGESSGQMRT